MCKSRSLELLEQNSLSSKKAHPTPASVKTMAISTPIATIASAVKTPTKSLQPSTGQTTPLKSQQLPKTPSQEKPPTKLLNSLSQASSKKPETIIQKSATPATKTREISSPRALTHFAQIIESVVSGMDDYSASRYGSHDFAIEPPRRIGTEVTEHEFEDFRYALEHAESAIIETPKSKKRKRQSIEPSVDIDTSYVSINSTEKHKKKKHRMSLNHV